MTNYIWNTLSLLKNYLWVYCYLEVVDLTDNNLIYICRWLLSGVVVSTTIRYINPTSNLIKMQIILLSFYLLKTFMYEFVNCKPSKKTNMCFVSVELFIILTTFVPLLTRNWYNNNYTNKCLSDTTIRYSAHNLFVSTALVR